MMFDHVTLQGMIVAYPYKMFPNISDEEQI